MYQIKLDNIPSAQGIVDMSRDCAGEVLLVSENVRVDLRSELTKIFALTILETDDISKYHLEIEEKEDKEKFLSYIERQEVYE